MVDSGLTKSNLLNLGDSLLSDTIGKVEVGMSMDEGNGGNSLTGKNGISLSMGVGLESLNSIALGVGASQAVDNVLSVSNGILKSDGAQADSDGNGTSESGNVVNSTLGSMGSGVSNNGLVSETIIVGNVSHEGLSSGEGSTITNGIGMQASKGNGVTGQVSSAMKGMSESMGVEGGNGLAIHKSSMVGSGVYACSSLAGEGIGVANMMSIAVNGSNS